MSQGSAIKLICGIALVFSLLMLGEGVVLGIMIALGGLFGRCLVAILSRLIQRN